MTASSEAEYSYIVPFFKDVFLDFGFWFVFISIFILVGSSNAVNLTDGLDGLSAGLSAIIVFTLGVFAWTSGNIIFSDYLNIMYIPRVGEITIFIAALLGSLVGFFGTIHIQHQFLWEIQEV